MRVSPASCHCRPWLVALAIGVLAAWNAQAALTFDFVAFDDDINLLYNPHLGPPGGEVVKWAFTDSAYMRRYVPLGWLGFSFAYAATGLAPAGYHAANLVLHGANAMLVFAILWSVLRRFGGEPDASRITLAAAVGAAFWALHPMRAETVGWASGLLYGVAGGLALGSMFAFLRSRAATTVRFRNGWLAVAGLLYACSVFTYPMSIGLWAVFALVAWADQRRANATPAWPRPVTGLLLLALPGAAAAAVTFVAGERASAFWSGAAALASRSGTEKALQAVAAWHDYVWRPWWPVTLTPAPTWLLEFDTHRWLGGWSIAVLGGLTVALASRSAWRQGPLLLWLAHLALLAPMLGLNEPVHFPANRYHYLAAVVLSAALALALTRTGGATRRLAIGAAVVATVVLAIQQRAQLMIWRDTDSLMERIVGEAGHAAFRSASYERWVRFHLNRGQPAEAERILVHASLHDEPVILAAADRLSREARDAPADVSPAAGQHQQLAREFSRRGRHREAAEHHRAAVALSPTSASVVYNYALFLTGRGEAGYAFHLFQRHVARAPASLVPPVARARLLSLVATGASAQGHPRFAQRLAELALAALAADPQEAQGALAAELTSQRRRYEAAADGKPR